MSDVASTIANALPDYEVGRELGRGGMGTVFEGRQLSLDRRVVIKELPSSLAATAAVRERFRSEAGLLASMDHDHIGAVHDFVEDEGSCLLVMEHLPGGTVWGRFVEQGLSPDSSCAIAVAVCEALHHAHQHDVLHCDVKPENVMFSADDTVKVTDFGIARVLNGDEVLVTAGGDLLGTPAYLAPEQAAGATLGPPADVFATGVMLYELLSGRLPYSEEGGGLAIVFRHANEDHIPLESVAPQVPEPIVDVIAKSLQRDPADRYQTAAEFGVAIAEAASAVWAPSEPDTPREIVKPSLDTHSAKVGEKPLDPDELVPLSDVLEPPSGPIAQRVATLILLAVAAFLAFGLGGDPTFGGDTLREGSISVADTDIAVDDLATVDFGAPIPVVVATEFADAGAARAVIGLHVAGLDLPASAPFELVPNDFGLLAEVDLKSNQYLVGGLADATLELQDIDGGVVLSRQFGVGSEANGLMSVGGGAAALLLLVVIAYTESMLRPLRRQGRHRAVSLIGLAIVGAMAGLALALLGWMLGSGTITVPLIVMVATVTAVAFVCFGFAAARAGRRRRAKTIIQKQSLERWMSKAA